MGGGYTAAAGDLRRADEVKYSIYVDRAVVDRASRCSGWQGQLVARVFL